MSNVVTVIINEVGNNFVTSYATPQHNPRPDYATPKC
jgi:hypothetical protein